MADRRDPRRCQTLAVTHKWRGRTDARAARGCPSRAPCSRARRFGSPCARSLRPSSCAQSQDPRLPGGFVSCATGMPAAPALRGCEAACVAVASLGDECVARRRGLPVRSASAVGYGLRPPRDCARCSAARASSNQVTAMTRHWLPGGRMAPSPSTRARKLADPGRLRASPLPIREPATPAAPLGRHLLAWSGKDIKVRSRGRA